MITLDKVVRTLTIILSLALAYMLIRSISGVLIPFLVAWLVAYMLYPIVLFVQHRCKVRSRILSIIITLLAIIGIIVGACVVIMPPVIEETTRLKDIIVSYVTTDTAVTSVTSEVESFIKHNIDTNEIIRAMTISDVSQFIERYVPQVFRFVAGSVNVIIGIVCSLIAVIYLFFILVDYETISQGAFKLVPKQHRAAVRMVVNDVEKGMNGYFRGQALVALCVGILFSIGFLIIDFPLAIPLGLFIGFLNLVPYLQTIGFLPTIVLALLKAHDTGDSFWGIMLSALIVFAVVQAIQDWVIVPRIMGKVTGLNAAVILLSLSVWGSLLGFVGLIIALPLTSLIFSYYKRFVLQEGKDEEKQKK